MNIPSDLKYAKTHEWARRDGTDASIVTVGITDHAQEELTDIVYVELPKLDSILVSGGNAAVVESVKAASDIYAPLSGTVVEINEKLVSEPALINTDPFGEGWLFKMRCSTPQEWDALLTPESYGVQIGS